MDIQKIVVSIESVFDKIVAASPYIATGIVIVLIIFLSIAVYQTFCDCRSLRSKFKKKIISKNDKLCDKLEKTLYKRAVYDFESCFQMHTDRKGKDRPEFIEYCDKHHDNRWNLIFEADNDSISYVVNPSFFDWLMTCEIKYSVKDFEKAVWQYFKEIDIGDVYDPEVLDAQTKARLIEMAKEDRDMQESISHVVSEIQKQKVIDHDKSLIPCHYNDVIKRIHDDDDHGLLPDRPQSVPISLYHYLYQSRIYGHQQIYRMMSDARWDMYCAKGCYIIYNTFNGKYFIGKSDNIYVDLKQTLVANKINNSLDLNRDLRMGHMILMKFVPLSGCSIDNLDTLYESLCRAYKSFAPFGYNNAISS